MKFKLDHIAVFAPSLKRVMDDFEKRSGVRPSYGGPHSDGGTHNALAHLGTHQYLEFVAPDPDQQQYPTETADWAKAASSLAGPRVNAYCLACDDLNGLAQMLEKMGLNPKGPVADSRLRPDGKKLDWELVLCLKTKFGSAFPFFIDWKETEHPSHSAPKGCELERFCVTHPHSDELASIFLALGIDIDISHGIIDQFTLELKSPKGRLRL